MYLSDGVVHIFLQTSLSVNISVIFFKVIEEPVYLSDGIVHLFLQTPLSVNISVIFFRVIEEPVYLSDGVVHLFLQTPLSVNEMEAAVDYDSSCNVADIVVKKGQACSVG